jgi:hypothetical protein
MIPEGSYPIPTHDTWSVIDPSKLEAFLRCPRKFFFEYILGWRSSSKLHNDKEFGTAWHEALAHLMLNGYDNSSIIGAFEKFYQYYRQHFDETTDSQFDPKNPEQALKALNRYVDKFSTDLLKYDVLYVEISGTCSIDSDLILYWRMDSIVKNRDNGRKLSIEHKTSKRLSRQWRDQWLLSRAIGTYIHNLMSIYGFEDVEGVRVRGTFFYKTKTEFEEVPVAKGKESMQNWLYNINRWVDSLLREYELLQTCKEDDPILMSFPMNDTSCTDFWGCPYHDFCLSWANPLRNCEEPPLGFEVDFWDPRERDSTENFEL